MNNKRTKKSNYMRLVIISDQNFDVEVVVYADEKRICKKELYSGTALNVDIDADRVRIVFREKRPNIICRLLGELFYTGISLVLDMEMKELFSENGFWDETSNFVETVINNIPKDDDDTEILIKYQKRKMSHIIRADFNVGIVSENAAGIVKHDYTINQKKYWQLFRWRMGAMCFWGMLIIGIIETLAFSSMFHGSGMKMGFGIVTGILVMLAYLLARSVLEQKKACEEIIEYFNGVV